MSQQPRTCDEFDFLNTSGPSDTDSESDFDDGASIYDGMSEEDFTRVEQESTRPAQPRAHVARRLIYAEAPNGFDETLEEEMANDDVRGCSRHAPSSSKDYYIVTCGRVCGVFNSWVSANQQVSRHPNFSVKKADVNTKDGAYQEWDMLYARGLVGGPNSSYSRIPPYYEGDPPPAPIGGPSSQPPRTPKATRTSPSTPYSSRRHASQQTPHTPTRASREPSPLKPFGIGKAREQTSSTSRSHAPHASQAASSSGFTPSSKQDSTPSKSGPSSRRNEEKGKWKVRLEPHVDVVLFFVVPSSSQRVIYHNYYEARANSQHNSVDVLCFNRYEDAGDVLAKFLERDML